MSAQQIHVITRNEEKDNKTWWLTLEPDVHVTSVYNHFLRFTMLERSIIWANFDINLNT
ncbi:MAG: hypothetical protein WCR52_14265 [Bacteroidota bacterium]